MKTKTFYALGLVMAGALLQVARAADIGNPAGDSPTTPDAQASPKYSNNVDQLFVQLIGSGGHAEVDAGGMAAKKARNENVRNFASRMVEDHKQANKKLQQSGQSARLDVPNDVMDPDHRAQSKHLAGLKGDEFDREYMRTQIADHQRTATLLEWEIGSGQNDDVKSFAAATLPTVTEHLRMARDIFDQLAVQ